MSAHDRWLANYSCSSETAYCQKRGCPNEDGIAVWYEQENGQGSMTPEDCPLCNGDLSFDRLPEATDGPESDS